MKKGNLSNETFVLVVQLIRSYGFAFVPLAVSYILMFYFLGRHEWRFVLVLGGATMVFLGLTHLLHPTVWHVLISMGGVSTAVMVLLLIGSLKKRERI